MPRLPFARSPLVLTALVLAAGLALPAAARDCPDPGHLAGLVAVPAQVHDPALLDCALNGLRHSLSFDALAALMERRIALARPGDGDAPLDPLRRMADLSELFMLAWRLDEAEGTLARAAALLAQAAPQTAMPRMRLLTLAGGIALRRDRPEEARRALDEAVRLGEGQVSMVLRDARSALAMLHLNQNRPAEAEAEFRAALAIETARGGAGSREALQIRAQMALALVRAGAAPQAVLDELRPALQRADAVLGPDDNVRIDLHFVAGQALAMTDDPGAALEHLDIALAITEARLGPDTREAAAVLNMMGIALAFGEHGNEAAKRLARAHRLAHDLLGEWHPLTLRYAVDDAAGLMAAGLVEAGLHRTMEAIARMRAELGETHPELRLAAVFARDEVGHHRPGAPELALLKALARR